MKHPGTRFSARRISAFLLILFSLAELFLVFRGPIRLTKTPSLMVAPILFSSVDLSDADADRLTSALEAAFASAGNSSVKPRRLIREYLAPQGRSFDEALERDGALALARELGILRIVQPMLSSWNGTYTLYLWERDALDNDQIASESFRASDLSGLIEKLQGPRFAEVFGLEVPGFSPFDFTFFLFLALEVLLALLILFRPHRIFNQSLIILGSTLFLFAWFFARNANMDYVQRFVALGGALKIASSTARQQLEVSLRFLPLLLVNLFLYGLPFFRFYFLGGTRPYRPGRAIRSNPPAGGISASIPAAVRRVLLSPPGLLAGWVSGILYALAFPSLVKLQGLPFLGLFALVPLFFFARRAGRGETAVAVMAFASAQVILINFWHSTYSYVSLPFTVLLSLSQWFIFLPFITWFLRRPGRSWMFLVPSVWVAFDWLRGLGYLAYPWGMLGTVTYSWTPFIQAASLTGVWGLTWLLTAVNTALADLLLTRRSRLTAVSLIAAALCLPLGFGALTLSRASDTPTERVLLVQHNRDPRKYDYGESLDALIRLTDEGLKASRGDGVPVSMVVWPETAFVPDIRFWMRDGNAGRPRRKLAEKLFASVRRWNTWLLTGSSDHKRLPGEKDTDYPEISYNSTYLISPQGKIHGIYHKIKLVPFTEYFPFKKQLPAVYAQLDKFDVSDWTPGSDYSLQQHPDFRFATPVCFEDIMPGHVRNFVHRGADMIVNVSNDYWSLSPVEGMQHGVNALFRSVENHRPLVRATASGLTMGTDSYGRILARLPFFQEGRLLVDLPQHPPGQTLYTRFGDWFPKAGLILSVIFVLISLFRRIRRPDRRG